MALRDHLEDGHTARRRGAALTPHFTLCRYANGWRYAPTSRHTGSSIPLTALTRQQSSNGCDIFPYKATPQQPRPKPLRVFISCCTVDDGLSCNRGGWRSVPLLCGISHSGAPDARSADLKYRVLVPPATAHTTLAASPLRSTNEAARRLVSLHYKSDGRQSSRRNPWHIPPFRSSSAISHTAHENPSLAALANTRQTSKILHGIATKDFTALRARGKPAHISFYVVQVRYGRK